MVADHKLINDHGGRDLPQEQCEDTEEEDTLSLCDLPIYGNSEPDNDDRVSNEVHWDDSIPTDHDLFEFSYSQDNDFGSSQSFQSENIVLCGKIIRYKQPAIGPERPRKQKGGVSRWWGSLLFRWGVSSSKRSPVDKYGSLPNSRWYLFVFGLGRFPIEMEMRDIKMRQSRRLKPTSPMFVNANGASTKKISTSTNRHGTAGAAKTSRIGCVPLL